MRLVVLGLALAAGGCTKLTDPYLDQCESYIQGRLKAPSSYKRVSYTSHPMEDGKEYWVSVKYDAVNSYNAPIRDTYICQFPAKDGKPTTDSFIDFDAVYESEALNLADNLTSVD